MLRARRCNHINWSKVSNFWEVFEEMGVSTRTIEGFSKYLKSPILVVGAGLGIVPGCLQKMGYVVESIDYTSEMVKKAKKIRNIDMKLCCGTKTPFKNESFNTVLINTGVIDTMNLYTNFIENLLKESKRVLKKNGKFIISFFREKPNMEFIYNCLDINKIPSNYCLFLEKNIIQVKKRFLKETKIDKNLIEFIFLEYKDCLKKVHKTVLRVGEILNSKNIEPSSFIEKYLGYEKFDFNSNQEDYLIFLVKKTFNKIDEVKPLCDKETCVIIVHKNDRSSYSIN